MSKQQIIEAIRAQNPTAMPEFLSDFDAAELENYLRRLTLLRGRRGRNSVWVRTGHVHAVAVRPQDLW